MHWILSINFTSVHATSLCPWQIHTIHKKTITYFKVFLFLTEHFLSSKCTSKELKSYNSLSGKISRRYKPCIFSHIIIESNFSYFYFFFFPFHLKKSISLGNIYTSRLAKSYISKEYSEQIWSSQCLPFICKTECELNKKHCLHKELANHPNPEKFKVLPIVS